MKRTPIPQNKHTGKIPQILATDIVAQVRGQDKYTLIYFPPSHLEKVQERWGKENLIYIKNAPKKRKNTLKNENH